MKNIYLDYAATTPVDKKVIKAMLPYFNKDFGNPSSVHFFGRQAQAACDSSADIVADFLHTKADNVIFTSGATESNNLAIFGLIKKLDLKKGHIITSAFEHASVLRIMDVLKAKGFSVTFIKPNKSGLVSADEFIKAVRADTFLVSCMFVNNEIGTIQPVKEIGIKLVEKQKKEGRKIYFISDAVQAAPFLELDPDEFGIDFLTLSSHKIYGPKGVGVLYVRDKKFIKSIFYGGHQQSSLRPGTLNVAGIVGLAKALEILRASDYLKDKQRIKEIQLDLWKKLYKKIPDINLNGDLEKRVPGNLNIHFSGVKAESLIILLDQDGIAVSRGSACSAGSVDLSNTLTSIGLSEEENISSLRISLGKFSRREDNDYIVERLIKWVCKLRKENSA